MKIIQIIPALNAGGAERTVVDITRAVVHAGGQALTITTGGRLEADVIAAGGQIVYLPVGSKNPGVMWRNIGRISQCAQDFGAQIVHARSRAPAWSARSACSKLGIPFVTTYHGTYNAQNPLKRCYNAIMARGDAVIANSYFIARHIKNEHGLGEEHITVIARGIDPAFFEVSKKTLKTDMPLIVMPARFTRLKGHVLALDALVNLRRKGIQVQLVFAGGKAGRETYVQQLQGQITSSGLDAVVSFTGHVSDMAALYGRADIVLCASIQSESFGRVSVEGQASARLCVAPAHGGSLETITDGKTGFHFTPGDANDLANVLRKALLLPSTQANKICSEAREHARSLYSREVMCAKTLELYRDLLRRKYA